MRRLAILAAVAAFVALVLPSGASAAAKRFVATHCVTGNVWQVYKVIDGTNYRSSIQCGPAYVFVNGKYLYRTREQWAIDASIQGAARFWPTCSRQRLGFSGWGTDPWINGTPGFYYDQWYIGC